MNIIVIDNNKSRCNKIVQVIDKTKHIVISEVSFDNIDWDQTTNPVNNDDLNNVLRSDCVILHLSDAQSGCRELIEKWLIAKEYSKPVILISGNPFLSSGYKEVQLAQFDPSTWDAGNMDHPPQCIGTKRNYYRYEQGLAANNVSSLLHINDFLDEAKRILQEKGDFINWDNEDWNHVWAKLVGYNPPLEAKLELLHKCLTPEGAKQAPSIEKFNLIKDIKVIISDNDEKTVEDFVKTLPDDGPFGKNYIKALETLRDALLQEY